MFRVMDARTIHYSALGKRYAATYRSGLLLRLTSALLPKNDGNIIRLFMPPLTEERRKEFVKRANGEGEHSKVAVRNIRRDAIEHIKRLQKEGLSEDITKDAEKSIQDITAKYISLIEKHLTAKEKEIMSV